MEDAAEPAQRLITSVPVTIGLVDSTEFRGLIAPLVCWTPSIDLQVRPVAGATAAPVRVQVPAGQIAYVGFETVADARPKLVIPQELVDLRVHLRGGRAFRVRADRADTVSPLGFFAQAVSAADGFQDLYFYARAVSALEDPECLGTLLIRAGLVSGADVEAAAQAQAEHRRVPLGHVLVQQGKLTQQDVEDAQVTKACRHIRLGDLLVEQGRATDADIQSALAEQTRQQRLRLGEILVEQRLITEEALTRVLAQKFHLPCVDLDRVVLDADAVAEVPDEVAERFCLLPVQSTASALTIAIADPVAGERFDVLSLCTDKRIVWVLATRSQLLRRLGHLHPRPEQAPAKSGSTVEDLFRALGRRFEQVVPSSGPATEVLVEEDDNPIIRLADQIIADACRRGASDVHIEPNGTERELAIRFRVDGCCEEYTTAPAAYRRALVGRYKVMASLDIAERRKPQDGKITVQLEGKKVELRVATLPTLDGDEDVVMRILASGDPIPLAEMGLAPHNLERFRQAIARPYGLVLCVGPTGSGKTTALHSALSHINSVERKIWTAEDPVEITQPGLRQVQVNRASGLTFATALRSFLRADPDVIMIGEMRDLETVSVAIEAALTGHLVFSTLHTNTAPDTVTRLLDIGVDPFSFGDALVAVLAQRLARRLCTHCRRRRPAGDEEFKRIAKLYGPDRLRKQLGIQSRSDLRLWRVTGCNQCEGSGYKGRVALHELLSVDDAARAAIQRKATATDVRRIAIGCGMTTLVQDGIEKAIAGVTDLRQVLAVCER